MARGSLTEFYLGGGHFGFGVLLFTLFATQYSGNTFFGFTGATYRIGYAWVMSVHFMTAVVVVYLLFAPRLHDLAKSHQFITPPDFLAHRFNSRRLTTLAAIVMTLALCNYLLAQLMAMGRAMQGLSGGESIDAYRYGVVVLAAIMVIYGTLGGMRAVAWTDAIQGVLLALGFGFLAVMLFQHFGGLDRATAILALRDSTEGTRYTNPPDPNRVRQWISYILMIGFGSALYPQAIQRIYAARDQRSLRRSLAVMAFLPLPTMCIAIIAGIMAAAHLPGLEGAGTDAALGQILARLQASSALANAVVVIMIAAILAAMMSTADSALLSISSMVSKDIYGRWLRKGADETELTRVGKICSWGLLTMMVFAAIALRDATSLVGLLDRKFDLLIQLVPAFILGIRFPWLRADAVFLGILVGLVIALALAFIPFAIVDAGKVYGFHPGFVGLIPNLAIAIGGSLARPVR